MASRADNMPMAFIAITGIIAFFPLAVAFGADSRPHDRRNRRWL